MIFLNRTIGFISLQDLVLPNKKIGITLEPGDTLSVYNEDARKSKSLLAAYKAGVVEKISDEEPVDWKRITVDPPIGNGRVGFISETFKLNNTYAAFVSADLKGIMERVYRGLYEHILDLTVGVTNQYKAVNLLENDVTITLRPIVPEWDPDVIFEPSNVLKVKKGHRRVRIIDRRRWQVTYTIEVTNDSGLTNVNLEVVVR